MRDPARIPRILVKLQTYWEKNPDLRLGQLVWALAETDMDTDTFYLEDNVLEEALDTRLEGGP